MARPQPLPKMTFDEFLEWESRQEQRHEFVNGLVYAMAGGSKNHNRIVLNIASRLMTQYDGGHCRVYAENILLRMELADGIGYYPDVMLVCDPDDAPRESYSEKPCALFEVLSDTTQAIDRGDKLRDYKGLASLTCYALVAQQAMHVTVHLRSNNWQPQVLTRPDDAVELVCPPGQTQRLTLAEIYRGLGFDA
ncbi:Uma2 family endonuclease [Nevskia sp.]|uniref:Uma2 family endonuclease n=1 Tax=Nevskia sp. TaxID=1929292 RepID=UPI0025FB6A9C|nr:Uma2 family endonuclease [Nevskia sp.]